MNFAFFSSPKLTLGNSYTLTGGSTTTTATAQTGTTTSSQPGGGQRPDGTWVWDRRSAPLCPRRRPAAHAPDGTQQPADGTTSLKSLTAAATMAQAAAMLSSPAPAALTTCPGTTGSLAAWTMCP
ncbi:MAG: hypothetical protein V8S34_02045 [Lawsonibacter sp.]